MINHPAYTVEYRFELECIWCEAICHKADAYIFDKYCWFGCTYNVHKNCVYSITNVLPVEPAINHFAENSCFCLLDEIIVEYKMRNDTNAQ